MLRNTNKHGCGLADAVDAATAQLNQDQLTFLGLLNCDAFCERGVYIAGNVRNESKTIMHTGTWSRVIVVLI